MVNLCVMALVSAVYRAHYRFAQGEYSNSGDLQGSRTGKVNSKNRDQIIIAEGFMVR